MNQSHFFKPISILLCFSFWVGCEKEAETKEKSQKFEKKDALPLDNTRAESVSFYGSAKDARITYRGQEFWVIETEKYYILEGDILLNKEEIKDANLKKTALVNKRAWPNNTVYYSISRSLEKKQLVQEAISHIESKTDIKFVERTTQESYIQIVPSSLGVYSTSVGWSGGYQEIGLADWATVGNIIHEFGHALGLFHEHTRADRDDHIIVNTDNVDPTWRSQFYRYTDRYNGYDYGQFDFGSIMLCPSSNMYNGGWSMTTLNGKPFGVQRETLSEMDIAALNALK